MRLFPLGSSSGSSLVSSPVNEDEEEEDGGSLMYLNVYDLTPINNYLYWVGLGIFHSGIEVHGMEYGFGAHEYPSSGVFEVEPRSCPGFVFRRSILLGSINMCRSEFRGFMEHLSSRYHGDTYHLIAKNCNHFTDEVSKRLAGKSIPGWVNRLARLGAFCNCLLPESIQITAVRHLPERPTFSVDADILSESSSEESYVTDDDSGEDEPDHHQQLLSSSSPNGFLHEKAPMRLAKELLQL